MTYEGGFFIMLTCLR